MVTPGIYGSPRAKCFCFQRTRKELQNPGKTQKQITYSIPKKAFPLQIFLHIEAMFEGEKCAGRIVDQMFTC